MKKIIAVVCAVLFIAPFALAVPREIDIVQEYIKQHPQIMIVLNKAGEDVVTKLLEDPSVNVRFVTVLEQYPKMLDLLDENPAVAVLLANQAKPMVLNIQNYPILLKDFKDNPELVEKFLQDKSLGWTLFEKINNVSSFIYNLQ